MKNLTLSVRGWRDYELLDSGDNRKLERYGGVVLIRPETQAIWRPTRPELWKTAAAEFKWNDGKGAWEKKKALPGGRGGDSDARGANAESWQMQWNEARFMMRLTSFKHTGMFPEQAANWEWIAERVMHLATLGTGHGSGIAQSPRVLNLFGYTGIASVVAAKSGASVTHVDASKQSNLWAKENAALSEIPTGIQAEANTESDIELDTGTIRYLLDDALKFVEREARRGAIYDGIILDPPAFGRGAKGEVWKIEEDIAKLLEALEKIFSKKPGAFFLLNGYAAGYSPQSFAQAAEGVFPEIKKSLKAEFGELQIRESASEDRVIPAGIYVRFIR